MSKQNTLANLEAYLKETKPKQSNLDGEKQPKKQGTKKAFINEKPKPLIADEKDIDLSSKDREAKKENKKNKNTSPSLRDIALQLHQMADKEDKSFAEIIMELVEEGATIDEIIPPHKMVSTMLNVPSSSLKVIKNRLFNLFTE